MSILNLPRSYDLKKLNKAYNLDKLNNNNMAENHNDTLLIQGFGMLLMEEAARIAREEHGSHKIAVISGKGGAWLT